MENPIIFVKGKLAAHYWHLSIEALEKHYDAHKKGDHDLAAALYRKYLKYRRKYEKCV